MREFWQIKWPTRCWLQQFRDRQGTTKCQKNPLIAMFTHSQISKNLTYTREIEAAQTMRNDHRFPLIENKLSQLLISITRGIKISIRPHSQPIPSITTTIRNHHQSSRRCITKREWRTSSKISKEKYAAIKAFLRRHMPKQVIEVRNRIMFKVLRRRSLIRDASH